MIETRRDEDVRTPVANRARRIALVLLVCAYSLMWVGGVAGQWLARDARQDDGRLAAIFLLLAGMIVLVGTRSRADRWMLVAVAVFGFAAEALGVRFGVPFGSYSYTDALGPRILGVPPVIALAWMTLAAYVKQMLLRFRLAAWVEAFIAAIWMTAFDLLLDPLASSNRLGYWRWAEKGAYYGVPLTNFAGWFVVSLLVFLMLRKRFEPNAPARLTGLSIIIFFTLHALTPGELPVALLGCALCSLHFIFPARKKTVRV